MKRISGVLSLVLSIMVWLVVCAVPGHAMTVTALDVTDGSVHYHGQFHRIVDRLLDQGGVVKMDEYQPIGGIVPSITMGHTTYSLFTSGFDGAPPPSATVDGSSIAADLSSMYLAVSHGESIRLWNIGGLATGTFEPATSQFTLSWKDQIPGVFGNQHSGFRSSRGHFLEAFLGTLVREKDGKGGWDENGEWRHGHSREATFTLEGTAVVGGGPTPVPMPASLVFYATGLLGLGSWVWLKWRRVGVA